jgi:hypothetical protein
MESSWSLSSTQRIVFFGFIGSPGPWAQATATSKDARHRFKVF